MPNPPVPFAVFTDATGAERTLHGTKAELRPGDLIAPGWPSNFGDGARAAYVYLTGTLDAAVWGAELARGDGQGVRAIER